MRKNFKGRCEKRKLSKCEDVCRTFDAIQSAYADLLNGSEDIKSFQVCDNPIASRIARILCSSN